MVSSTTTALGELGTTVFSGGGQKYTSVAQGSAGTVAIAAASTGKKFRVLAAVLANVQSGGSPGTAQFKSGSTALNRLLADSAGKGAFARQRGQQVRGRLDS